MATQEAPDFNGMPVESFRAGLEIAEALANVPAGQKAVLLARSAQYLVYETMGDTDATPEQIEEAAVALVAGAEQLRHFKRTAEHRLNPPEPIDLDY